MMTDEELLQEAKRMYPVGSKFKSVYSNSEYTVESDSYIIHKDNDKTTGVRTKYSVTNPDGYPWLYWKGNWARVISLPENYTPELSYVVF